MVGAKFGVKLLSMRGENERSKLDDGADLETEGMPREIDGSERDMDGADRVKEGAALRDGAALRAEPPMDRPPSEDRLLPGEEARADDPPPRLEDWAKTSVSTPQQHASITIAHSELILFITESIVEPPYHPQQFFHTANSCGMININLWSYTKQGKKRKTCFMPQ